MACNTVRGLGEYVAAGKMWAEDRFMVVATEPAGGRRSSRGGVWTCLRGGGGGVECSYGKGGGGGRLWQLFPKRGDLGV